MSYLTEDERWEAITNCEVRSAGRFVYGLKKCSLYHSPICRRRPNSRCEVVFYDEPSVARSQGREQCPECYPDQAEWLAGASRWV